ncbi:hypothetical protein DENSPDRAFT_929086 [Dentipellis sp. KUC8613]|nr:hypothetical protein DENSPDRAFT_929086 [Dentipellis sp. KUC8613]
MSSRHPGTPRSTILANELPLLEKLLEQFDTPVQKFAAYQTFIKVRLPPEVLDTDFSLRRHAPTLTPSGYGTTEGLFGHPAYLALLERHGLDDEFFATLEKKKLGAALEKAPLLSVPKLHIDTLSPEDDLWGSLPAYDILNLPMNKIDDIGMYGVAFIASSDLRNLILTVNALPPGKPHSVRVLFNDPSPIRLIRNILILYMLTGIPDRATAADAALHLWYSAFLPDTYEAQARVLQFEIFKSCFINTPHDMYSFQKMLTDTCLVEGQLNRPMLEDVLAPHLQTLRDPKTVRTELDRSRVSPPNIDRLHRRYCQVEPAHRQAMHHFRKTGILLPFGAATGHFDRPNSYLLSPEGKWLLDDLADPLQGWPIEEVMKAGKAHGVQRGDVYGALYFYLTDQLRTFIDRLHTIDINITFFAGTASELSKQYRSGELVKWGIVPEAGLTRVDAGTLGDSEGWARVVQEWAPLLWSGGLFLGTTVNWARGELGQHAKPSGEHVRMLTGRLMMEKKIPRPSSERSMEDVLSVIPAYESSFSAVYDTARAFMDYVIAAQNLGMKDNVFYGRGYTSVVPHRLGAKIGGIFDALPDFPDAESWYLNVNLVGHSWTERSFEIGRYPREGELGYQPNPKNETDESNTKQKPSEFMQGSSKSR